MWKCSNCAHIAVDEKKEPCVSCKEELRCQNWRYDTTLDNPQIEGNKYCYTCGTKYEGDFCPQCSSTIFTDKPNSQTNKVKEGTGCNCYQVLKAELKAARAKLRKMQKDLNEVDEDKMYWQRGVVAGLEKAVKVIGPAKGGSQ